MESSGVWPPTETIAFASETYCFTISPDGGLLGRFRATSVMGSPPDQFIYRFE